MAVNRTLDLGTDTYVISFKNVTRTRHDGDNIFCVVDKYDPWKPPATVLIVSRLPDEPKNFACETHDMRLLRCKWRPGELYNFYGHLKVSYRVHEWVSMGSKSCERDHCDWTIQKNQQIYNFTLTAKNILGERSINSTVHLHERIRLLAPFSLRASQVSASAITLAWSLKANYTSLQIHCQVDPQTNPGREVNKTSRGMLLIETYSATLSGLQPYTQYDLRVRCMAESSLAGWSNWAFLTVRTLEDVPTGTLDVWRRIKDVGDKRNMTLYWKPSSFFQANGDITHYHITWGPLHGAVIGKQINDSSVNSFLISIERQAYNISITAYNRVGGSPPAELRIPAKDLRDTRQIDTTRAYGKDGGIYITWKQDLKVHGYVVEWCEAPISSDCDPQWKKYNSTVHNDIINSGIFREGQKYNFAIYGCMKDGDHLLERTVGYTVEWPCSKKPNVNISEITLKSVFLNWLPYRTDECTEGFVIGYNIYVKDTLGHCDLNKSDKFHKDDLVLCRFDIRDPTITNYMIAGLKPNRTYEVAVVAITGGGETSREFITFHTRIDAKAAWRSIWVPIITVLALALALLFIGCWKRAWLKRTCLPEIPDPSKTNIVDFNYAQVSKTKNGLLTTNGEHQMVDVVSIQENGQHKEANDSSEYQLDGIHNKIQTREGSQCDGDVSNSYVPYENEGSLYPAMNDPTSKPQQPTYLELFNQTYNRTLDDISDNAIGYRPQNNTAKGHCVPYNLQSVDPGSGLDDDTAISFISPGYVNEPMSPTSVGSTTFMLVD